MTDPLPPTDPRQIDPRWLTATLHAAHRLDASTQVHSVRVGPVDLGGVNGDVYRLLPRYSGSPGPLTLIAKFPAADPAARRVAAFQRWYEREVRTYREIDGRVTGSGRATLPAPDCYCAERFPDDGFLLLLEDLGVRAQGDQLAGCSAGDAQLAVRTIARAHARWWDSPDLQGRFDWLPLTTVGLDHAASVQDALARAWATIGPTVRAPRPVATAVPDLVERYPDLLAAAAQPPLTVIHGDYRLDNLFFDVHEGERRMRAIDWQFTSRCRGMYDVAYFVGLDLQPDARRSQEAALRDAYRDTLAAAGVRGYTDDAARRDYALGLLLAFVTFVIGAASHQASERMRAVHDVGLQRLSVAIAENDAMRLLG